MYNLRDKFTSDKHYLISFIIIFIVLYCDIKILKIMLISSLHFHLFLNLLFIYFTNLCLMLNDKYHFFLTLIWPGYVSYWLC